jgi:hypothetical protein
MPDNCPVGIIPYEGYQRNMQSVIEQKDDKGIKPFCERKACRRVRLAVGHLQDWRDFILSCYEQDATISVGIPLAAMFAV